MVRVILVNVTPLRSQLKQWKPADLFLSENAILKRHEIILESVAYIKYQVTQKIDRRKL